MPVKGKRRKARQSRAEGGGGKGREVSGREKGELPDCLAWKQGRGN